MPQNTRAGFFSIVSDFISSPPQVESPSSLNIQTMPLLKGGLSPASASGGGDITIVAGTALVSEVGPLGTLSDVEEKNRQISTYIVQQGDTLSEIAEMFDVSVNTVIWANDIKGRVIKEGQMLVILPISGITHVVKSGDTIQSIAKKYSADKDEIVSYNEIKESDPLKVGQVLTIPDGDVAYSVPVSGPTSTSSKSSSYFIRPAKGVRTQGLHGYNGIDIGAPQGTPIIASASGVVIVSRSSGWNGGYGSYVVIKHKNGTQTLYAHMSSVAVRQGQTVSQGQTIGKMGNTGKSTGPHLHFEVRGGKNPF